MYGYEKRITQHSLLARRIMRRAYLCAILQFDLMHKHGFFFILNMNDLAHSQGITLFLQYEELLFVDIYFCVDLPNTHLKHFYIVAFYNCNNKWNA